jgi:hypothetical protein
MLLLGLMTALAAWGDSGQTGVVRALSATTNRVAAPADGPGPYGKLGFAHLGPVKKGMSKDDVLGLFGSPTKVEPLAADPGSCQVTEEWTWDLPVGAKIPKKSIAIDFEPPDNTVAWYSASGGHFKTDFGVGMGSSYQDLRRAFGRRLKQLFAYETNLPPGNRRWIVHHGKNQLLFVPTNNKVDLITGGHIRGCQ